jgi:hypothetical protein
MDAIFNHIVQSYNSLWKCRTHGNSLEVITPSSTTNDTFVSVFITKKGDEYIVADGGWINSEYYGTDISINSPCYDRLFAYYYNFYQIKETQGKGTTIYYKKTTDKKLIPNLVYDLSGFISSVVSASFIGFVDEKEVEVEKRFRKQANDYLTSIVEKNSVKFNSGIDERFKNVKFGAVITKNNRLHLINYITGSNEYYFYINISKTNFNFEIIENSLYAGNIASKIAIINDSAPGYKPEKQSIYIDLMKNKRGLTGINWSDKDQVMQLIQ